MIRTVYVLDKDFDIIDMLKQLKKGLKKEQIISFYQSIDTEKELEKFEDGFAIIDAQGNINWDNLKIRLNNILYYLPSCLVVNGKVYSIYSLKDSEIKKLIQQNKTKVYKIIEVVIEEERGNIEDLLDDLENAILEKDYIVALEILEDIREEVRKAES